MTSTRRASLLAVFAHPDDELFHSGTLMSLSQRGVRVTLVCATNGEAGKTAPIRGNRGRPGSAARRGAKALV